MEKHKPSQSELYFAYILQDFNINYPMHSFDPNWFKMDQSIRKNIRTKKIFIDINNYDNYVIKTINKQLFNKDYTI
jgi:hypothetical protein